ncbi:MAG: type I-C CRISPR-associated protein Cas5c [Christensenellales bacterium]|jgi:CRISPR-associated protein Cas5d
MGYGVKVEVWGDYALFSRPELKTERVSYDVITPSAARGILDAILWHPGMQWVIDRIHVLNPISFTNVRRNELKNKLTKSDMEKMVYSGVVPFQVSGDSEKIMQRASLMLKDVRYVIEAHFVLTDKASPSDTPEKFYNMALRRLRKGQCYHQPCLGTRECTAHFRIVEGDVPPAIDETRDLGLMLYDLDYSNPEDIQPMFFRARLDCGVMEVANCEVFR